VAHSLIYVTIHSQMSIKCWYKKLGTSFMELSCHTIEGIPIVTLSVETPLVRQKLNTIIGIQSPYLIFDLSRLNFVDARGLSILVSALKMARKYGGEVLLLNPTPVVRALIELTRLQQMFRIYADEASAIKHCRQVSYQVAS